MVEPIRFGHHSLISAHLMKFNSKPWYFDCNKCILHRLGYNNMDKTVSMDEGH